MWPVSPEFLTEVSRSHAAVVEVEVSPGAGSIERVPLKVLSGSVVADRTRDVRRTCNVDLTGELTPAQADDLLAPFGSELHVRRGVQFADGTEELVPLGVFRIGKFTISGGPDGTTIALSGSDRAVAVKRATWEDAYVVDTGTAIDSAIAALVVDRYPAAEVALPPMTDTTWQAVFDGEQGDPWQDARKLADAAGHEAFFDPSGQLSADEPASTADDPDVTYTSGADAVMLGTSRQLTSESGVHNAVVGIAEHPDLDEPLRAFFFDDDPSSPTYYHGPFGHVHRRWSSQLVRTQQQLNRATLAMLNRSLGASEDVELTSVVNPALRPNDVIEIDRADIGLDNVRLVVDRVSVPLTVGATQTVSGRRRFL